MRWHWSRRQIAGHGSLPAMTAPATKPALAAEFPAGNARPVAAAGRWRAQGRAVRRRLVTRTYDGLRIEPLYPRNCRATRIGRTGARRAAGRSCSASIIPIRAAANAQALDDLRERRRPALVLVFAGSASAPMALGSIRRRHARRARSMASISTPASRSISILSRRRGWRRRSFARAGQRRAARAGRGRHPRLASIRSAALPLNGGMAAAVGRSSRRTCRDHRASLPTRLPRAIRGRRRPHHPQRRRLRSAGARFCAGQSRSPICARSKPAASRSMPRAT